MTILAIAGGSASGKSTLAGHVCESVEGAVHVSLDDFYLPIEEQPDTFDDPSALDWEAAASAMRLLDGDVAIHVPEYSFEEGTAVGSQYIDGEHIVLEGLWSMYSRLRPYIDVGVYIETDPEVRLARRIRRDTEERGVTVDEAIEYFQQARKKEKQHVEFQRDAADLVVDGRPTERDGEIIGRLL